MSKVRNDPLLQVETTCGSLLRELQIIWDDVGESETERDKMLLEIEQECLEVYRRKLDQANRCRAQLRKEIADSEAELAAICSEMGERSIHIRQSDQNSGSLKEEQRAILPLLEEMRKRKCDRRNQFVDVVKQIQTLSNEFQKSTGYTLSRTFVDETDLSLRKLEELHGELQLLQKEKSDRLNHVLDLINTVNSLCLVLGIDFKQTVNEVHPSLGNDSEGTKDISNDTIEQLGTAIKRLREVKLQRMQRLQDIATSMLELWNLMDTPFEEQQMFQNVTCNIAASEHEITEPNRLSVDFLGHVEAEVSRLEELKASKMKELVLKKRLELEEICRKTHLIRESDSAAEIAAEAIESGAVDPACVLEQIELQISKVKEEAFSRIEILEKVEKWLAACEEESWLEEYNMDDNRYNAGKGTHLTLKRAEKARALVGKLPGMVEALASKVISWENDRGIEFTYDGIRLLSMLEEYKILRQEKEEERRRQRDQKKLQGQLMAEKEAPFGSKSSHLKLQSGKKGHRLSSGGGSFKRDSAGGTMQQTPKKSDRLNPNDQLNHPTDVSVNAREVGSPTKRKPFFPSSSTESAKSDTTNLMEDSNGKQNEKSPKTLRVNSTQFATPSKIVSAGEEETRTPKAMPIPLLSTPPSTVSVRMQTTMTPAVSAEEEENRTPPAAPPPPPPLAASYRGKPGEETSEDIEYSFEERRAGFVLPRKHLRTETRA